MKDLEKFPASKFENFVRVRMEKITGKKFPTVYLDKLKYKNKSLELDGYNPDLNLAFECQGPQHTTFMLKYDKTKKQFENRVHNDKIKRELCDKHGIGLILVDYRVPKYIMGKYLKSRIYDIGQKWLKQKRFEEFSKLDFMSIKPPDYVETIHEP